MRNEESDGTHDQIKRFLSTTALAIAKFIQRLVSDLTKGSLMTLQYLHGYYRSNSCYELQYHSYFVLSISALMLIGSVLSTSCLGLITRDSFRLAVQQQRTSRQTKALIHVDPQVTYSWMHLIGYFSHEVHIGASVCLFDSWSVSQYSWLAPLGSTLLLASLPIVTAPHHTSSCWLIDWLFVIHHQHHQLLSEGSVRGPVLYIASLLYLCSLPVIH